MLNTETQMLHDRLCDFLKESIPILAETIDVKSVPTLKRYRIEKDKDRVKIAPHDSPNWWQVKVLERVSYLSSLHEAIDACNKHEQLRSLDGKWSYAFHHGTSFHASNVPIAFLKHLIHQENGLRFRKKSFEAVFDDFLRYVSSEHKCYARLVVPLENLAIAPKLVHLEQDSRIRTLTPKESVDLRNNCPILGDFYGTNSSPWFRCILEFDIPFNWSWRHKSPDDGKDALLALMASTDPYESLKPRINQEIVILRALLNRRISPQTYVLDYRGWESVMFSGGEINFLPWVRSRSAFPHRLTSKEIANYKHYRRKFLDIKDNKTQQRIFVAMRKLAFSIEKPYGGDELMDTVSGLEGLLVDSATEVRHKFAEHVALLLERDPGKRKDLQRDMLDAYDLRSRVAHGSAVTDDIDSITSQIRVGKQPKKERVEEFNRIQELRKKTRGLLHQAILVCIDKQRADFDWDSSVMGTRINP